jgi:hypothetical protein
MARKPQTKTELLLDDLLRAVTTSSGGGLLAQESTLQGVLQAIQDHQDFEMKLVRDTGNADKVVCEIAEYDESTDTYTYTYKDVGGAAYVPVGPLEYLDPSAVLNLILTEIANLNTPQSLSTEMLRVGPGAGSIAAGARRVSFMNVSKFGTTVKGVTLARGEFVTFAADGLRDTLDAIPYTVDAGGELLITRVY